MSDTPAVESGETHKAESASRWELASRWGMVVTPVIALVALVLAALAYLHPAHTSATGTAQQSGDAKANLCAAYAAAHNAVVINTHLRSANPNDPTADLAVATSARLALIGGGAYLKDRLDANTAAPKDVADAIDSFANTVEQLGINYLNQAATDAQESLRRDLNSQISAADKLCS